MVDTLNKEQNEALIAEMLRDAKTVELPSELREHPIVHAGDTDMPAPMTVKEVSSAGYVYIWDTRTYNRVPVLRYMLPSKLRQRRPDGSYRFTTNDPGKRPLRGTFKCMLHPKAETRVHFDELGFRVCPKDNINNQYQLDQHMSKKHPQEWKTIQAEKLEKERAEDRALQHLLLRNQLPKEEPKTKSLPTCDICGADFGTQAVLDKHKLTHEK